MPRNIKMGAKYLKIGTKCKQFENIFKKDK